MFHCTNIVHHLGLSLILLKNVSSNKSTEIEVVNNFPCCINLKQHFTVVCSVTSPLNDSKDEGDYCCDTDLSAFVM